MSRKIAAQAYGNPNPPTAEGINVVNGDFLIVPNRYINDDGQVQKAVPTGDGVDEETCWTFYFAEEPEFPAFTYEGLSSALLSLTLIPKDAMTSPLGVDRGIGTDALWIETLNQIVMKDIFDLDTQLPNDVPSTISIELLNFYNPQDILNILFSNVGGRILMRYNDDAIITFAQLELTQGS